MILDRTIDLSTFTFQFVFDLFRPAQNEETTKQISHHSSSDVRRSTKKVYEHVILFGVPVEAGMNIVVYFTVLVHGTAVVMGQIIAI